MLCGHRNYVNKLCMHAHTKYTGTHLHNRASLKTRGHRSSQLMSASFVLSAQACEPHDALHVSCTNNGEYKARLKVTFWATIYSQSESPLTLHNFGKSTHHITPQAAGKQIPGQSGPDKLEVGQSNFSNQMSRS